MNIIAAGVNHKSAPIDIRERLAFDAADTMKALRQLKHKFPDTEFVLLSTCNRVELYCASPSLADARDLDGMEGIVWARPGSFLFANLLSRPMV